MDKQTQALRERIEALLDGQLRPDLAAHGGGIEVLSLEEGVLRLRSTGPCANCPSAQFETEERFGEVLMASIPEIQDVVMVTGVSDDLLAAARALLGRR